ncbi:MAG: helicase, partial [Verrucomicrobiota bacterium]
LTDRQFRLEVENSVVTIDLHNASRDRLSWLCSTCPGACEHVGAAFSLILEEKMALGLAAAPPERIPIESLGETELVETALEERRKRAKNERMKLRSANPDRLWTDYTMTSALTGKSYRLTLRGWERGESYCSGRPRSCGL